MTTSSNLNQSGEGEELRPKLLALLKGGQVINNTTDHNERSVLEMLYGEKADQIEELIHQRELEAKIDSAIDFKDQLLQAMPGETVWIKSELRDYIKTLSKQKGQDNDQ